MFELLEAGANFAGMLVSMDCTLFKNHPFYTSASLRSHYTDNLYKSVRWGGFHLETMPKWDDTPLGKQEADTLIHVQAGAELRQDATGVDCFERYDGIDQ